MVTAAMGSTVCADLPSLEYCMRKRGMGVRGEVVLAWSYGVLTLLGARYCNINTILHCSNTVSYCKGLS